jgi:hypothetical protein
MREPILGYAAGDDNTVFIWMVCNGILHQYRISLPSSFGTNNAFPGTNSSKDFKLPEPKEMTMMLPSRWNVLFVCKEETNFRKTRN